VLQSCIWDVIKSAVGVAYGHRERERELNTRSVGAIGSVQEEGRTLTTVRSRAGARRISEKPFEEFGCREKRGALRHKTLKTRKDLHCRSWEKILTVGSSR
jgi:hypothetical protein